MKARLFSLATRARGAVKVPTPTPIPTPKISRDGYPHPPNFNGGANVNPKFLLSFSLSTEEASQKSPNLFYFILFHFISF
jgi:hypothetical protein